MKISISFSLNEIYKKQHKNYDYSIASVLDNLDPDSFINCFEIVKEFELEGNKCEINIGDEVAKRISDDLELPFIDGRTVELLLWMGAILPEV